MSTVRYKGYEILAQPYQLYGSKRWTVDLVVRRSGRSQGFSLEERYPTEPEATARCTSLARRIIDGAEAGRSVQHLRARRPLRPLPIVAGLVLLVLGVLGVSAGWARW